MFSHCTSKCLHPFCNTSIYLYIAGLDAIGQTRQSCRRGVNLQSSGPDYEPAALGQDYSHLSEGVLQRLGTYLHLPRIWYTSRGALMPKSKADKLRKLAAKRQVITAADAAQLGVP